MNDGHFPPDPHSLRARRAENRRLPWRQRWPGWPVSRQMPRAQGVVRSVHQDWQIRCDTPPGAQSEQCALMQSVVAEDRANVGLTVIVLKTADNKSRVLRVIAPLGVLLPAGLGPDHRQAGRRPGRLRALPAARLLRRGGDGRQPDAAIAHRAERHLHYFPDARRGHRIPVEPQGLRRRLRQAARERRANSCRRHPSRAPPPSAYLSV